MSSSYSVKKRGDKQMIQQDFTTVRQHMKKKIHIFSMLLALSLPAWADGANVSAAATGGIAPQNPAGVSGAGNYTKGQGAGIGFSEDSQSRIHLGLDFGFGFNTNPYAISAQAQSELQSSRGAPDLILKLKPAILLNVPSRKVAMDLGLAADAGLLPDVTGGGKNYNFLLFNGKARGQFEVNRDGVVSFFTGDQVSASKQPAQLFVGNLVTIRNDLGLGIRIRPIGGLLAVTIDGRYGFEYWPGASFIDPQANPTGLSLDNENLYGHLRIDWRFAAAGSFFIEAQAGRYTLTQEPSTRSYPFWAQLGVSGALTSRLNGTISAGYTNPFVQLVSNNALLTGNFVGIYGTASLDWTFAEDANLALGYIRNANPVPLFLDVITNSGYVRYSQLFGRRVKLNLMPTVTQMYFGLPLQNGAVPTNKNNRQDVQMEVKAEAIYYVRDWFGLGFTNTTQVRWTNAAVADINSPAGQYSANQGYNIAYTQNESLFVLSLNY